MICWLGFHSYVMSYFRKFVILKQNDYLNKILNDSGRTQPSKIDICLKKSLISLIVANSSSSSRL